MSRRARLWVLALGGLGVAVLLVGAALELPGFGGAAHPYGDRSVHASLARHTANVIASVNFDQRAFDTLGEESILFCAALGTVVLLRQTRDEHRVPPRPARVSPPVRRYALIALPVTLLIGLYVVAHGQLSPGGGFQGGVVVATSLHLLYVAVDYRALERIRPVGLYAVADGAGEAAYLLLGVAGTLAGTAYLANVLPYGTFNTLASGGTVPLLNAAIGVEVASGVVVLLASFLDQAVEIEDGPGGPDQDADSDAGTNTNTDAGTNTGIDTDPSPDRGTGKETGGT
ncbi:MnhB domain-containing protein [Streptomyces sp. MST-110588]|uniref:MnhB domain-containing protein n=1 Tax=Streptomyces sp. MST-110588 TaxID=2833628 RepID=UPI001F5CAAA3|nr:MnhB domain-containing protein [Streptomyces sp. MST-110588]UNO38831.1 sodium:proton antiporter [Streptomyces sp. MST-110588]